MIDFLIGDPVRLRSPMPFSRALEKLEARVDWVRGNGTGRGWVFGRYFIIAERISDDVGPVLYLKLSPDSFGTRLRGRAGNGLFTQWSAVAFGLIAAPSIIVGRYFLVHDSEGLAWLPVFMGGTLAFLGLWRLISDPTQPLVDMVASELNALPDM